MSTSHPNPEARFDRASLLVLAAVAAFTLLVVWTTVEVLALPGDGWQAEFDTMPPQLLEFFGDWPTPLRAGDKIQSVGDLDVTSAFGLNQRPANLDDWREGATVRYTLERDGQTLQVPVVLHRLSPGAIVRALFRPAVEAPAEWSWAIIALVVFWRRPRSLAARQLLLAMVVQNVVTKLGWAATTLSANFAPGWLYLIHMLTDNFWSWLFWPTVIWLILSFPMPVFPLTRWPRLTPIALYALPAAALAISLPTGNLLPITFALVFQLASLLSALVLSLINAYRQRANAVVRAQAAWVILGFGISQGLVLTLYLLFLFVPAFNALPSWIFEPFTLALPICLGIAITRYRLFDIDVLIRRTLVYGVLTALLAVGYLGSVLVLQNLFGLLTGSQRGELVTVLSTLGIAAAFVPLRAWVQRAIDRRLYRRKYDAAQTLAQFAAAARDEVELDRLSTQLVTTVEETMQPAAVSLWLKPGVAPAVERHT
jgi:hypothetical protein